MIRMVNINVWFWGPDDKEYDEYDEWWKLLKQWKYDSYNDSYNEFTVLQEVNTDKTVQIRRSYFERTWTKHCLLGTMENTLKHSNILAIKNTSFTINL